MGDLPLRGTALRQICISDVTADVPFQILAAGCGVSLATRCFGAAGELERRAFRSLPEHLRLEILANLRVKGQVA